MYYYHFFPFKLKYYEIDVEKYKELINNFNLNYSIFLIHNEQIIELKESNEKELSILKTQVEKKQVI